MQSMGLEDALKSCHLHLRVTEQVIFLKIPLPSVASRGLFLIFRNSNIMNKLARTDSLTFKR